MDIHIIKRDGTRTLFDPERLRKSLQNSGASDGVAEKVLEQIIPHIKEGETTDAIYQQAFTTLGTLEKPAAIRYSLRTSIFSYGPTGFPFEKFAGRLFEKNGYMVSFNKEIKGKCTSHEIDVLARGHKTLAIEVKFHSRVGLRVDLKTVLYVHSRFRDLTERGLWGRANKSGIDGGVLATNAKFTTRAIQYAECAGIELLGWGYPRGDGLEKLIDSTRTHPITCLPSIRPKVAKKFFESGIIICADLFKKEYEEIAQLVGDGEITDMLYEESKMICI